MKIRILIPLFIFLSLGAWSQDVALPDLTRRVTDLTGTLTPAEQNSLEQKLLNYENTKGSQVVVVLIPTTGEETTWRPKIVRKATTMCQKVCQK